MCLLPYVLDRARNSRFYVFWVQILYAGLHLSNMFSWFVVDLSFS